jgi:hypothetical protein
MVTTRRLAARGSPARPARPEPDAYDFQLIRMVGAVAAVWQLGMLIQVLIYLPDYRQPTVLLGIWLGLLAAAAWLVPRAREGGLSGREAMAAVAIAIAAVALVGWERRMHGSPGTVDWSVAGTGWLLALVAVSRPAWLWICGSAGVFAAHAVFTIADLGTGPLGLSRLAVTAYTLIVVLAVFAALRPAVRACAAVAARRAELVNRSAAESAAAAAVRADRQQRLALLEAEALPTLRGIGDGSLDPADPEVQARCARDAAALRRALADRAGGATSLLAELEPALRSAAARGLTAEVQVVGDPGLPSREVAAATLAAVDSVLRALPPHPVTLTVLAAGAEVELYVTFARPPLADPELAGRAGGAAAAAGWRAAVDVEDTGAGCLEVRWPKQAAA